MKLFLAKVIEKRPSLNFMSEYANINLIHCLNYESFNLVLHQ
jgi:hypothetical protein